MNCKNLGILSRAVVLLAATLSAAAPAVANPAGPGKVAPRAAGAVRPPGTLTPSPETIYESIAPCRAFDTSATSSGPILTSQSRAFFISGTTGFGLQGGHNGGCGVPASATAVSLSLTSSASTANGWLTAFAFGSPLPNTRALSFAPNLSLTAGVNVAVAQSRIFLRANGGATQAIGDVTGYFAPQIEAFVNSDGSLFSNTSRVLATTRSSTGVYTAQIDRDVYYCSVTLTEGVNDVVVAGYGNQNNIVNIYAFDATGAPVDTYFNLAVHC